MLANYCGEQHTDPIVHLLNGCDDSETSGHGVDPPRCPSLLRKGAVTGSGGSSDGYVPLQHFADAL